MADLAEPPRFDTPGLTSHKKILHDQFYYQLPSMLDPIKGSSILFIQKVDFVPSSARSFVTFTNKTNTIEILPNQVSE